MGTFDPYGAGLGPAGFAPLDDPSVYVPPAVPLALLFDGATGDWVMLADTGEYVICHPADQAVAIALCTRKGAIRVARKVGNTLHLIKPGGPDVRGQVEDAVRTAVPLKSYLDEGTIELRKIEHWTRPHGGLVVSVTYKNLATGLEPTITTP